MSDLRAKLKEAAGRVALGALGFEKVLFDVFPVLRCSLEGHDEERAMKVIMGTAKLKLCPRCKFVFGDPE